MSSASFCLPASGMRHGARRSSFIAEQRRRSGMQASSARGWFAPRDACTVDARHAFLRPTMASASTLSITSTAVKPAARIMPVYASTSIAPVTQSAHLSACARNAGLNSPSVTMSLMATRPPGLSTRNASRKTDGLVGRQVDDAVRHNDVHRVVRYGQRLDLALAKLDILDAHLALAGVGLGEHVVGHVHTDDLALLTHLPRRQEAVDAAAAAQVEHRLARLEAGDRHWIAAAKRKPGHVEGQPFQQRDVIQTAACAALSALAATGTRLSPQQDAACDAVVSSERAIEP